MKLPHRQITKEVIEFNLLNMEIIFNVIFLYIISLIYSCQISKYPTFEYEFPYSFSFVGYYFPNNPAGAKIIIPLALNKNPASIKCFSLILQPIYLDLSNVSKIILSSWPMQKEHRQDSSFLNTLVKIAMKTIYIITF